MTSFDLFIIGAGPGGYVAAIKAAKNGLHVAVAEREDVGGTCLNRGCIPTKALLHASELFRSFLTCESFGLCVENPSYDLEKIYAYKEDASCQLRQGVENLLKANGITVYRGSATIHADHKISVESEEGTQWVEATNILIASGSKPAMIPIPGVELQNVLNSDDLLRKPHEGSSLAIIGGGVIGVEFATVFSSLGWEVTILEALPALLANMDKEISQNLKMILKKQGVTSYTGASVTQIAQESGKLVCHFQQKEKPACVRADYVLVAVGRRANTDGLLADDLSLQMDRGKIVIGEHFQTSESGIYAIGDVTGGIQLAHAASAQGMAVADALSGKECSIDLTLVPSCVYTNPEIASVGLTEAQAKEQDIPVRVGKFIMSANGKSLIGREERGFIKLVFHGENDRILGAQLMCARATDMVGQLAMAIANNLDHHQLTKAMAAHPTFYEAINEAAEDAFGGAIHILPKRR